MTEPCRYIFDWNDPAKDCSLEFRHEGAHMEGKVEAGDRALETARKIIALVCEDYPKAPPEPKVTTRQILPLIQSAMNAQERESFWVVERFEDGKSAGYWDGGNSRSFQFDIVKAIQFRRKEDAFWATRGWHWKDVQITEHLMMAERLLAEREEAK